MGGKASKKERVKKNRIFDTCFEGRFDIVRFFFREKIQSLRFQSEF